MIAGHLVAKNVCWRPGRNQPFLLNPVSFEVYPGRVLGVVGPNGAGKSTLLRMVYHYQKPTSGQILVDGQDLWGMSAKVAARKVAAVLQEQPGAFGLSVRDIVALGRTPHRSGLSSEGAKDAEIIDAVMQRMQLEALVARDFDTLSGGERQRVMVARALAQQPQVLVMDEPTNHLDIRYQLEILSLIRSLGLTIVVSLHDLNMAADVCDAILLLKDGHCKGFGSADDVLSEQLVSDTFSVIAQRQMLSVSQNQHLTFHLTN